MKKPLILTFFILLAVSVLAGTEFQLPQPEKMVLDNGLTVFFYPNHELPLASFTLLVPGAGTADEPAAQEGVADLTATLLLKGANGQSAEDVAARLDYLGANLRLSAQAEFASMEGRCLAEYLPQLMSIASAALTAPTLAEEEFTKERDRCIDVIRTVKDNPRLATRFYFTKAYFGDHPLGHLSQGSEATLAKMTAADVRQFYSARYRPDRCILSVAGDLDRATLIELLNKTLAKWARPSQAPETMKMPALPTPTGKVCLLIDKPDATQTYFMLGAPGFAMGSPLQARADVVNTLFGGRFTSWLNSELRIKRGLTYGARSSFQTFKTGGIFTIFSYTRNEKIGEMLDITFDMLKKARQTGFTGKEIQSAINYIQGQFPPRLETIARKADAYAELTFYGQNFDYYGKLLQAISQVTVASANKTATDLLPMDNFVLVVVGKADEIQPQLEKFGHFTVRKISTPGF